MFRLMMSVLFGLSVTAQAATPLTEIRVGWQIPWATQGQLVQIWKHTSILQKNGLKANFVGRTYGPMLNELAIGGDLDVVLTGDMPGLVLISKNKGWRAIGRLMYNRTVTFVPTKSPIQSLKELKGKSVALPMGAAAERVTREALADVGLDSNKDVKVLNLDLREQAPLILSSEGKPTFSQFDALAAFDPLPAIFETEGKIRVLHTGKVVSVVLMNEDFLKKNPKVGHQVMQALFDAYDYYRTHVRQANEWFLKEAGLNGGSQAACDLAASIEPNLKAKMRSDLRVSFSDDDLKNLKAAAEFLEQKTKQKVDVDKSISNDYAHDLR